MLALTTVTMAWVVGVCVAMYLGAIVFAIAAPSRQPDPHRGVGVGCLMLVAIPGVLLGVLLAVGVTAGYDRLVRVLFYVTVLPTIYVLAMLVAQPLIMRHKNRNEWDTPDPNQPTPSQPEPASPDNPERSTPEDSPPEPPSAEQR